jgi:predicted secreted Zn-dependent protease
MFSDFLFFISLLNQNSDCRNIIIVCNSEWVFKIETIIRSQGMYKGIIVLLLLMPVSLTSYAGEDSVNLASVDRGIYLQKNSSVVPPLVTEQYEYYDVRGDSEATLRCDITKNGCRWSDGKKYDSVTTWRVKWHYGYERGPQTCSAESFQTSIDITFRYPKWVRDDAAPQALVDKWDRYMKNLVMHENVHRDMAVSAAEALSCLVAAMPPASSCAELDRRVRVLYKEQMQKLSEDEKKYDATTNHGITQGAVFP